MEVLMLEGMKILITGPASQVAFPVARALARHNEVYGLARFGDPEDRARVEAVGLRCLPADLAKDSLADVPRDFDYVLHFAVVKTGDFAYDLAANAEGTGRLMARCRGARAFFYCSSGGVYAPPGQIPVPETGALGDNHRAMMPTYSISKIAAETVVRFAAREWNIPSTIARLSVPYGENGGWPSYHLTMMQAGLEIPLHPDRPCLYNPIHEDDYVRHIPALLDVASVPATTLNWGGSDTVSLEEWCAHLGTLTGLPVRFRESENTIASLPLELTRMHAALGRTTVDWRDGLRRMVQARHPELLRTEH